MKKELTHEEILKQFDISEEEILSKKDNLKQIIGIYFLIKNHKIIYVGQSQQDVRYRIQIHFMEKDFDNFYILECPREYLSTLEAHFIVKFEPELNDYTLPSNPVYKSLAQLKKHFRCNVNPLKKWIKENKLKNYFNSYYKVIDFKDFIVPDEHKWRDNHY